MLIQIHMLQNYAPSNLNRDDSGSPKSAVFGGYQRGRVSSQCLKRSIRRSTTFREAFQADNLLAARTKRLPQLISDALQGMGVADEARKAIVARVPEIGQESTKREKATVDPEKEETRQLIFIGSGEAQKIAEKLLALYQEAGDKQWQTLKIEEITNRLGASVPLSVDIAMFGRMTTSAAFEDVQAAVQVAHALATNRVTPEYDYYTAVDDLKPEDDPGAGMIGDVEFNSSTYYKYFNVHWEQLVENLGGDREIAARAVTALIEAAAMAQPSGKQNSFAAHNLPDFILVEVSPKNIPVSYANAFIRPAYQSEQQSLMGSSVAKLNEYAGQVRKAYSLNGQRAYLSLADVPISNAEGQDTLAQLQAWAAAKIAEATHG
ncbi:MAG: type I-E CRISPR-associated protein Cas7/Cse4/CasC [Chloroflexi bacterium]|nr:type I-E CRISPR-associated protein Cas7/Cse4/CasC [Chloroflexota bacterium]MCI0579298.1 type I-E CRISPR-associated protein Cas7/Cse4/CasC [Chloroflexota bacterium]MCI0649356.1 type I-E CRISPR-associated protein Cas7/Cse4/CasC [Chloroflexota bacterium]MCI0726653.1 type I-E CRISPR-associated protein Cas7/Cse4/CasC [Chloroflexota bacterium]